MSSLAGVYFSSSRPTSNIARKIPIPRLVRCADFTAITASANGHLRDHKAPRRIFHRLKIPRPCGASQKYAIMVI